MYLALPFSLLLALPSFAAAQEPPDAYLDATARALVERARGGVAEAGRAITSYTATVQRRSAARLRMPLRDRLLAREEAVARVRWSRYGTTVVQMLGGRSEDMTGEISAVSLSRVFDPTGDRVYFGAAMFETDEGFWIAHPLAEGSERYYRYRSGDTLTLRLPDGSALRAVELRAIPRRDAFNFMNASLWIEPASGALVRAVYRPARNLDIERDETLTDEDDRRTIGRLPGLVRPVQLDVESVVVEYSLWSLRHWLPRLMRVEGHARAGVFRVAYASETAYRIEAVEDEETRADAAEPTPEEILRAWGASGQVAVSKERREGAPAVYWPADRRDVIESSAVPPPIWEDAPVFVSQEEIDAIVAELERAFPRRGGALSPEVRFAWGWSELDLLRYNRVEALSSGARLRLEHPLAEAAATVRLGLGDLNPNAHAQIAGLTRRRRAMLEGFHMLASVDEGRALGIGNSLNALLLGRDDGEYYRATGVRLSLLPTADLRETHRVTLFAERQRAVGIGTHWSLPRLFDRGREFRAVLPMDDADLLGASLHIAPRWGTDPLGPQGGLELAADGATGDYRFARARVTARGALPLGARTRIGIEAAAGTARGSVPLQYHWFLGGPRTLRGYPGSAAVGTSMARGRLELASGTRQAALALFADAGWAGERRVFSVDDALLSAGAGVSIFDGIVRVDLTRALRAPVAWRLDLYLDALL